MHQVQNIFVSNGTAFPANDSQISALTVGKVGIYGIDATALNPAGTDTVATQPEITVFQANGDSTFKKSMVVKGKTITKIKGASYKAATRNVWSIGYNRKTAAGSISVTANDTYRFSILVKSEKTNFSQKNLKRSYEILSAPLATQLTIANQIVSAVNNDTVAGVSAFVVGDGTGPYGLTGAVNYGVEITGKVLIQYATDYIQHRVYVSVNIDSDSSFSTTEVKEIVKVSYGEGTYAFVYNTENFDYGYEGVANRISFPLPKLTFAANANGFTSSAITPTANIVTGSDKVVFSATIASILNEGDFVTIDGNAYEIKYKINTTDVILTAPALTTNATATTLVKLFYDVTNIEFSNPHSLEGVGTIVDTPRNIIIATPAIDAGAAYNSTGAASQDVMDILNAYAASIGISAITL